VEKSEEPRLASMKEELIEQWEKLNHDYQQKQ